MTTRRRGLLLAVAVASALALALLLAGPGWPSEGGDTATQRAAVTSRQARPASPASARRAPTRAAPQAQPAMSTSKPHKTGIPACDDYVERTMTCDQLPADAKIAIAEASKAWARVSGTSPRRALEDSCRATASVQRDALAAMGC